MSNANGSDLPPQIALQGFVKLQDGRAHLLLRVPLSLLDNLALPKRGPGYLDLTNIDPKLKQAGTEFGRQIELEDDDTALAPALRELRLSFLSDRSFASYSTALAHLQDPPLPLETNLFWNQGFFDAHLEYALKSPRPNLRIRVKVGAELGQRVRFQLEYLPGGDDKRTYEIPGDSGWIPLDPRWSDAAWLFAKKGFLGTLTADRIIFILCLVAPFRSLVRVLSLTVILPALGAMTLTAAAQGALADVEVGWLPALSDTVVATAIVLLAIANLARPTLRHRCFLAALAGAIGGFGLGRLLNATWQFTGSHPAIALASFNVGAAAGLVALAAVAFYAQRLIFSHVLGPLLGGIVLSSLAGHAAWHWMVDGSHELGLQLARLPSPALWSAFGTIALWLLPALLVGIAGCFLPRRFDGLTTPTLLDALQPRRI